MQSALPTAVAPVSSELPTIPLSRPHHSAASAVKRGIDIVGALVGLLILGILFLPLAVLIKLDSPGPILYSQERYGLMGRAFRIYKFRSMVMNADDLKLHVENQAKGLIFKNQADPRITRVGHFLRRTSLDEFPQFWNVLMGTMSLVGTRPPTLDEVVHYETHHWKRLLVKPGLTGEWQVHGRSNVCDFEEVVRLDLRYQSRWTLLYDLRLIGRTIFLVLARSGAF